MTFRSRLVRCTLVSLAGLGLAFSCGLVPTLREYLSAQFWLPFARWPHNISKVNRKRLSVPFAGMSTSDDTRPLNRLRKTYQSLFRGPDDYYKAAKALPAAVAAARAQPGLSPREQEELDLLEAKVLLRTRGTSPSHEDQAESKLIAFLKTSKVPEYSSEARGWLAHIYYLRGQQSVAGKMYFDELTRPNSNVSLDSLFTSLRMVYVYDGGQKLLDQLEDYFDTADHATFALEVLTNPHWHRYDTPDDESAHLAGAYPRLKQVLRKHATLLRSANGGDRLAMLSLRLALRMGELGDALSIVRSLSPEQTRLASPDLQWMVASTFFLNRQWRPAEAHLLALFRSRRSSQDQKAAAAYGLCGVYLKTGQVQERLRFAWWLDLNGRSHGYTLPEIYDMSVYWSLLGSDLAMLLEAETPLDVVRDFAAQNPAARRVHYALAVRLAREHQYDEAARIFAALKTHHRVPRMRKLAELYAVAKAPGPEQLEAKYAMAEYLSQHSTQIYFNDDLWHAYQRYSFTVEEDVRFTRSEREALLQQERQLKDQQEEYWQAYLLCRQIVDQAPGTGIARRAAKLGVKCLRRINTERFGRYSEIRAADIELSAGLTG